MNIQFSIIIPTYNRAALLGKALDSVFAQTFAYHEVIVVDDGSADETQQVVAAYGGKVRFLRQQNLGPGAARNLGARLAVGEYLAFLDSDDLWFPWTLATYEQLIAVHQQPSFVVGKPLRFREEAELKRTEASQPKAILFSDYLASSERWRWWGVSSFVIRREAFAAAGGFTNERVNGEDADLALRLGISPGFLQVLQPATFAYREHNNSVMKNFSKTLAGVWLAIHTEQAGEYRGGQVRQKERLRILTRHVRPVILECLQQGLRQDAWLLYRAAFRWNCALGCFKFLLGVPLKALISRTR